jgi:hypothetical protein
VYIVPLIADWENQRRYHKSKTINWRPFRAKANFLDNKLISRQIKDQF